MPFQALLEDRGEALAERRIEALARREHQAGGEAADRVAAREQRHAASLLQLQDAEHVVVERVLVDLEQLVARIGIEDRQQRLAVVAVGDRGRSGAARLDPAAQQRHVAHRGVIGGRGEQADQAPLAGDAAVGVVGLHDHAVHRARCDGPAMAGRSSRSGCCRRRGRSAPSPRRRRGRASNRRTSSRRRMPSAEPGTSS